MSTLLFTEPTELSPALVGREPHTAFLQNRIDDALKGNGSVVAVAGGTGMGKTRLMAQVERQARECGMLFLYGAGDPIHSRVAYGLFIGVLRDYLQHASSSEQSALQEAIEDLAPHLTKTLFPRSQRRSELPLSDLDPDMRQVLFLARLAHLLLERQRPVLVCLEDLHWADSASLQALRYLATRNKNAPLLLVATYRPEDSREADQEASAADLEGVLREMQSNTHFHELELDGLSAAETKTLVSSCFSRSGFGDELLESMYRKTGGSPFFVVQYLEFLRDKRMIYQRRGLWMDRSLREPEGPESIHAVLHERAKNLSAEERDVLTYATPQGETFDTGLVAWALGWPHVRVLHVLEQLEDSTHMVRSHRGEYRFAHILMANAFFTQLPEEQRRSVHLRLATCLEQHQSADVELLAHHFYRAAALAQALPYLIEAGKRAYRVDAFWEAHGFYNRALEALERIDVPEKREQRLEVLLAVAEIDELLGELDRSEELCEEVFETASLEEDRAAVGQALMALGWLRYRKGEWEEAKELYHKALTIFADMDDAGKCAKLFIRLGNITFERSQLDEAAAYFHRAKEATLEGGNHAMLGGVYGNLGVLSSVRGRYQEAVAHYTEALQAYRKTKHHYGVAQIYQNLGMTYAAQQEWDKALTCYAEGEKLGRELGTVDVLANILVSQASARIGLGDLEGAEASCQSAQIYYEQMQDPLGLAECDKVEGVICRERAHYVQAEVLLLRSRQSFQELENQLGKAECDQELGLVRRQCGDVEGARRYLQAAVTLFEQIGALEAATKANALLAALTS